MWERFIDWCKVTFSTVKEEVISDAKDYAEDIAEDVQDYAKEVASGVLDDIKKDQGIIWGTDDDKK